MVRPLAGAVRLEVLRHGAGRHPAGRPGRSARALRPAPRQPGRRQGDAAASARRARAAAGVPRRQRRNPPLLLADESSVRTQAVLCFTGFQAIFPRLQVPAALDAEGAPRLQAVFSGAGPALDGATCQSQLDSSQGVHADARRRSVKTYVKRGGVVGSTVRLTGPSRSRRRSVRVSIRWLIPSMLRRSPSKSSGRSASRTPRRLTTCPRPGPGPRVALLATVYRPPRRR